MLQSTTAATFRLCILGTLAVSAFLVLVHQMHYYPEETRESAARLWKVRPEIGTMPGENVELLGVGLHTSTVIFLHGLGGTAAIAMPFVNRIRDGLLQTSFLLPNSEVLPVTANDGDVMPSWFDIETLKLSMDAPLPTKEDKKGLEKAVERIRVLFEAELKKGIEPERIIISGFSQGCAVALLAALSTPHKIGGLMCLSGWLPLSDELYNSVNGTVHPMQSEHAHHIPLFWGHGVEDTTIHYNWGLKSLEHLDSMGFKDVEFHSYPGLPHWIGDDEGMDVRKWVERILPPL